MTIFRSISVVIIALSVVASPMAKQIAQANSPATSFSVSHSDCCPHGKPCESNGMKDCGSMAGCALKCFNLFSATVSGVVVKRLSTSAIDFVLKSQSLRSYSVAPALPPPRV